MATQLYPVRLLVLSMLLIAVLTLLLSAAERQPGGGSYTGPEADLTARRTPCYTGPASYCPIVPL